MQINMNGVEVEDRTYIKEGGNFTLKCVAVNDKNRTPNGNTILKITFQNKHKHYHIHDVIVSPNSLWKLKEITEAFGFGYDSINTDHFVGMYLVAFMEIDKVKNRNDQIVDVVNIKRFSKSAKLTNEIPPEGQIPVEYERQSYDANRVPEVEDLDEIIPF